jgi:hypothetical protein
MVNDEDIRKPEPTFDKQHDEYQTKFANVIADIVFEKTAATFTDFMENIKQGIQGMAVSVSNIEQWKEDEKVKIEEIFKRLDKKKEDIATLRIDFETNKKELEEIAKHKPTLQTLQNAFNFWKWKNWYKIAGIIAGIIVIFFFIFIGFLAYMKWRGYVTQNTKPKTVMEQIWSDIKTGNISSNTRSIHYNKLSKQQEDSIHVDNQRQDMQLIKPVKGMNHYDN